MNQPPKPEKRMTPGTPALLLVLLLAHGTSVAGVEPAPSPGAPPTADLGDFVASLEGGWIGNDNDTPFGKMPFAVLFEWAENGSLHSRSSLNSETYIDLRFEETGDGVWMLHEEASMEGLGLQSYSLVPAPGPSEAGAYRWTWEQDPEFLSIEVALAGETMSLDVLLRGQPHVAFRLDRQPPETWIEMKRQMLAQAERSPAEGTSIFEVVSNPPVPPDAEDGAEKPAALDAPIERARREVTAKPDDAQAHLALARVLSDAINESPANAPRYAYEMLSALQTAVALDNRLAEAYHYLVGYYLNAPPIAGGSVEKAEETAKALSEFDPEGGKQLLSQIANHQARRSGSGR